MYCKYKMSICMIVRDEEKNLRRCLDSVKALIEEPGIELVIVDTGSIDSTIDIAKEYTSNVFFHKWNNNFSDMRNISISYAKGEWIFVLDADEVLENPNDLSSLLFENTLNRYNTIEIRTHNYYSLTDENSFAFYMSKRIFKNDGSFKYTGAVHNQPSYKEPILSAPILLKHYGYILEDNNLIDKKFLRTSQILISEIKKDPGNIYYIYKLSEAYNMHGDKQNALAEIKKAYSLLKQLPVRTRREHAYVYGNYARIGYGIGNVTESRNICEEGISIRPDYVDLYFILAECQSALNEKDKMLESYKKYLELIKRQESLNIKNSRLIMYNIDENSKYRANYQIAKYYYEYEKYEEAFKYIVLINGIERDSLLIKILLKLKKYDEVKKYYGLIRDNRALKENFINIIEEFNSLLCDSEKDEIEKQLNITEISKELLLRKIKLIKPRIQELVEQGKLEDALICINEYEQIISGDIEIYSMKAVINIIEENMEEAEKVIKEGLEIDKYDPDLNYNLAYIYERKGHYLNALETYEKAVFNSKDDEKRNEIIKHLNLMETQYKDTIKSQLYEAEQFRLAHKTDSGSELNLHLMYDSQYCDIFMNFVNEHFNCEKHFFLIVGNSGNPLKYINLDGINNAKMIDLNLEAKTFMYYINKCSRIFVHYLFDYLCELICRYSLSKPVYWIMWGGDYYNYSDIELYDYKTKKLLRSLGYSGNSIIDKENLQYIFTKSALRKIDYILSSDDSEYQMLKSGGIIKARYKPFIYASLENTDTGKRHEKNDKLDFKKLYKCVVLAGNSADPSNNHIDMLDKLKAIDSNEFYIVMPLSYGGPESYINSVISEGKKTFGERFIPLVDYLNPEEYDYLLSQVDVALFNHKRAQARGNIRKLLSLGKKVYLKKDTTTYPAFTKQGLKLFDIDLIERDLKEFISIDGSHVKENKSIISKSHMNQQALQYYTMLDF